MPSLSLTEAQAIITACLNTSVKVTRLHTKEQPISYGISKPPTEYILYLHESRWGDGTVDALTYSILLDERKDVIDAYARAIQVLKEHSSMINTGPAIIKIDHEHILLPDASFIIQSYPYTQDPNQTATLASLRQDDSGDGSREKNVAEAELYIGLALKSFHAIENEWYGGYGDENGLDFGEDEDGIIIPKEPCISWQECFTWMIESLLDEMEKYFSPKETDAEELKEEDTLPFDLGEIRTWLSSAIGMYLFDDVEVPVLVWNPGLDWDECVVLPSPSDSTHSNSLTSICFTRWTRSMWGDPLLEGAFYSSTKAIIEGYGGSPILFARQKIKRLWYTLWAALGAYLQFARGAMRPGAWNETKLRELLRTTVDELRGAKYY